MRQRPQIHFVVLVCDLAAVELRRSLPAAAYKALAECFVPDHARKRLSQRGGIFSLEQQRILTITHEFGNSTGLSCDGWHTGRHCFEQRNAECFAARWKGERACTTEQAR